jgi:hypothetical protein
MLYIANWAGEKKMSTKWIEWNCRVEQEQAKLEAMIYQGRPMGQLKKQAKRVNKAEKERVAAK